jgi:ATP-dependent exoDNAse (exonuclease V) beta subunit
MQPWRPLPPSGDLPLRGPMSAAAVAFTPEQRVAIERRRAAFALAAAAGSGKTSVLVERYTRAVIEDGIAPGHILAITFTERAAGELRERVRGRLLAEGRRQEARESAAAFVSTFHGFCARVLRGHAVIAGLPAAFGVLDDAQAATLREGAFDDALAAWMDVDAEALELAASFGVGELRAAILAVYDELRSRGERAPTLPAPRARHEPQAAGARLRAAARALAAELGEAAPDVLAECVRLTAGASIPPPGRVRELALARRGNGCSAYEHARVRFEEACADALGVPAVAALGALLAAFAERYRERKLRRGMLDFDDLELEAAALFAGHEDLRAQWSERFELVMIDELQDTNARQLDLLAALDRGNLFTVGDELQSIYGFRHADVALFRERQESLRAAGSAGLLSSNFRSRPALLRAVNAVFGQRFGERFTPLVAARTEAAGEAPLIDLLVADTDGWEPHEERLGLELAPAPLWRRVEARLVARRIDRLIRDGAAAAEDVVVLFRAGTAIGAYETALADLGHATLATAGGGFFKRPEVVDLVAYVQVLANPLDDLALYGVLASPLGGWDADALAALTLRAREQGGPAWTMLAADPPDARAAELVSRLRRARRRAAAQPLADMIAAAVAEHGYDRHLAGLHGPERRLANVARLEALAREHEAREGRDLRAFAQALAARRVGSTREVEAPPPAAGTGAIRLMTIHAAKGLEFPVVCVADLAHAPNRGEAALLTAPDGKVGLRLPTAERERFDTLDYAELREQRRQAAAAEEERILYVAMTRARERLILSGAARLCAWPCEPATPLAWLGPALVPDIATRAQAGSAEEVVAGAGGVPVQLSLCGADRVGELAVPQACGRGGNGAPVQLSLCDDERANGALEPAPRAGLDSIEAALAAERGSAPELPSLSYTSLAEYERCGYRYYLQRVLGLADVEPAGAGAGDGGAARGVVIHALLERLDFARPTIDAGRARALARREGAGEDHAALAELAGAFARSPLCARLAAAQAVRREQQFAFALGGAGGTLLRGVLDVAGVEDDATLLVVDYKSDRVGDDEDLGARVERDYSLQRIVYALAGLAAGAPAVEVAHCFLRRPETVVAERYAAAARGRLEALLEERLAPLRAGRFEVSGEPGRERCGTCPGRARLCSHEEVLTLRDDSARA